MVLLDVSTCIRMGGSGQSVELLLEGDCVTDFIMLKDAKIYRLYSGLLRYGCVVGEGTEGL